MPGRKLSFKLATPALLAVAALMSNTSPAWAGMLSYSHVISPMTPPYSLGFTLTDFDPSMGTLTGVTVTTATSGLANVTVYNFSQSSQGFTNATAQFNFNVTDPTGATFNTLASATVASGTVGAAPTGGFNSSTYNGNTISGTNSENIAASGFSAFESAVVPLNFSANISAGTFGGTDPNGGSLAFGGSGMVGATVTVRYTFTPFAVPEPASAVMLGLGLVAAGGVTLRRRSAK